MTWFFNIDPQGVAVQTHHVHTYSYTDNEELDESATHQPTREVIEVDSLNILLFSLFLRDIGKQCRPRSDAAQCSI